MANPLVSGRQLSNNVTELTAIAPLLPKTADRLRLILAGTRSDEAIPIARIQTIHYARWVIIDDDTRLLFTSNFDGRLDDYLEEFAERDEFALNTVFSSCVGWPGAKPSGAFIDYVRKYMVPAAYYYSAYPKYTVKEVKRALHWKQVTEVFLQKLAARQGQPLASRRADDAALKDFMEALARPTLDPQ